MPHSKKPSLHIFIRLAVVASCSTRNRRVEFMSLYLEFVADEKELGIIILRVFGFPLSLSLHE